MKRSILVLAFSAASVFAQNAAVSSYFDPVQSGTQDVRIREVRIPAAGNIIGTYWCTLGYWTTGSTSGYGGMQWTSDASQGPRNYIYSQWNNYTTSAYSNPKTIVSLFSGEGTGVKSVNNDPGNQWKPDIWHVTADRVWSEGSNSHFAYITRNGETGVWRHIMTWNTPEANLKFSDAGYCFLEDWADGGGYRESQLRKGWNRSAGSGAWLATTSYRYHINDGDILPGKRSYDRRTQWAGGIKEDATGKFFYMGAGGNVACTNNNGTNYTIARSETSPQQEYGITIVNALTAAVISGGRLALHWANDSTTVPQWSYKLMVKDGESTVLTKSDTIPQKRDDTLNIAGLAPETKLYTVYLEVTDFFDGRAVAVSQTFGNDNTPLDSTNLKLDNAHITLGSFDSQQAGNEAALAFDGDTATFWHTAYDPADVPYPHALVLKLDTLYGLRGLTYLPRQTGTNGTIKDYRIEVSTDSLSWNIAAEGSFAAGSSLQTAAFDPLAPARYVRIVALSEQNGAAWASAAEFGLLYDATWSLAVALSPLPASAGTAQYAVVQHGSSLHISQTSTAGPWAVTILSLNGRSLFHRSGIQQRQFSISLSEAGLIPGVYALKVGSTSKVLNIK